MSEVEHYFENLIHFGKDIEGNDNKDFLSKEVQEVVEECALHIRSLLDLGILTYTDANPIQTPISETLSTEFDYYPVTEFVYYPVPKHIDEDTDDKRRDR